MLETQLQWIRDLHRAIRSPWVDTFFIAWDFEDTIYFALIAITLAWYLWDRKIGVRLFYVLIISFILNKFFKYLFDQPRPCQIDPLVGILCSKTPGFPSGGAQSAIIYAGVVWIECRKKLLRALAVLFVLFVCFARVYLGVHYPTDILGGLVIGFILLVLYKKGFPLFERHWKWAAFGFPVILLLLEGSIPEKAGWFVGAAISLFGVAAGLLTCEKLRAAMEKNFFRRLFQWASVVAGLVLLFIAEKKLPFFALFWEFAKGYWLSFLGGWLVQHKKSVY